jgi:hypothetical protein
VNKPATKTRPTSALKPTPKLRLVGSDEKPTSGHGGGTSTFWRSAWLIMIGGIIATVIHHLWWRKGTS